MIFLKNIVSKRIFSFITISLALVPASIALAQHLLSLGISISQTNQNEFEVVIFAVCIFLLSLFFPLFNRFSLESHTVDFYYYLFAIIGVVLLFWSSKADREKSSAYFDYASTVEYLESNQALEKILVADKAQFNKQIAQFAKENIRTNEKIEQLCKLLFEGIEEDIPKHEIIHFSEYESCINYSHEKNNHWIAIAQSKDIAEQIQISVMNDLYTVLSMHLNIDGQDIPIMQAKNILLLKEHSSEWKDMLSTLKNNQIEAQKKLPDQLKSFNTVRSIRNPNLSFASALIVSNYIWPYFLIVALGMKIARKPYFYILLNSKNKN